MWGLTPRGRTIVREGGRKVKRTNQRIVGWDCGLEEHCWVLLDEEGDVERDEKIVNRRDAIEEVLAGLLLGLESDQGLIVVLESRRSHGRIVAEVAEALGCELWQLNTVGLDQIVSVSYAFPMQK